MEKLDAAWEDLRREARKLEGDLDMKLSSYAKLGGMLAHGGRMEKGSTSDVLGGDCSWKSMEMEIECLLEKLVDVNDSMSRCAVAAAPTASVTQKLARHRDILHEFTQEFKRTRGNINSLREHAELLTSVRNDISEYKASGSSSPGPSLLRERAAIHGNISQIEEVIIQAQSTKGALSTQRSMVMEIQGKVKHLSDRFPIIRSVLDRGFVWTSILPYFRAAALDAVAVLFKQGATTRTGSYTAKTIKGHLDFVSSYCGLQPVSLHLLVIQIDRF